jgi:hypothetical protein
MLAGSPSEADTPSSGPTIFDHVNMGLRRRTTRAINIAKFYWQAKTALGKTHRSWPATSPTGNEFLFAVSPHQIWCYDTIGVRRSRVIDFLRATSLAFARYGGSCQLDTVSQCIEMASAKVSPGGVLLTARTNRGAKR